MQVQLRTVLGVNLKQWDVQIARRRPGSVGVLATQTRTEQRCGIRIGTGHGIATQHVAVTLLGRPLASTEQRVIDRYEQVTLPMNDPTDIGVTTTGGQGVVEGEPCRMTVRSDNRRPEVGRLIDGISLHLYEGTIGLGARDRDG